MRERRDSKHFSFNLSDIHKTNWQNINNYVFQTLHFMFLPVIHLNVWRKRKETEGIGQELLPFISSWLFSQMYLLFMIYQMYFHSIPFSRTTTFLFANNLWLETPPDQTSSTLCLSRLMLVFLSKCYLKCSQFSLENNAIDQYNFFLQLIFVLFFVLSSFPLSLTYFFVWENSNRILIL